jgi:hypothetical protein
MDAKDIAEDLQDTSVEAATEEDAHDTPPEKMLSVSRVNELVKKAKRDKERQMQEKLDAAMAQIQELQAGQQQPPAPEQQAQPPQGIDPQALQSHVMQLIEQKSKEDEQKRYNEQLEQEVNQVATQYFGKMAQGKDLYEDFQAITADFNPAEFPQLVYLANEMDNTPAVIYELAKNPSKLAAIDRLVERSPNMARAELAKLSESIKRNVDAKANLQEPQDPLSRLKPSPVGTDGGTKNVRDFKKSNFLRV